MARGRGDGGGEEGEGCEEGGEHGRARARARVMASACRRRWRSRRRRLATCSAGRCMRDSRECEARQVRASRLARAASHLHDVQTSCDTTARWRSAHASAAGPVRGALTNVQIEGRLRDALPQPAPRPHSLTRSACALFTSAAQCHTPAALGSSMAASRPSLA